MYDLLTPVREMEQDAKGNSILPYHEDECKTLLLCGKFRGLLHFPQVHADTWTENIAFLVRHHYSVYGKRINPNDMSLVTKNWAIRKVDGTKVGVAVFVIANGFSNTVLRAIVENNSNVIDKLSEEIDKQLRQFFPDI